MADAVHMAGETAYAKFDETVEIAMRLGVEAGRLAYRAGRMPMRLYASASSPLDGLARF